MFFHQVEKVHVFVDEILFELLKKAWIINSHENKACQFENNKFLFEGLCESRDRCILLDHQIALCFVTVVVWVGI